MLTDTKLMNIKAKDRAYKVADRDGLYVAVTKAGGMSFRYNYALNGRQETVTFGRYGVGGITLAEARERLGEAKRMIADGKSPAKEKARDKARVKDVEPRSHPATIQSSQPENVRPAHLQVLQPDRALLLPYQAIQTYRHTLRQTCQHFPGVRSSGLRHRMADLIEYRP